MKNLRLEEYVEFTLREVMEEEESEQRPTSEEES